MKKKKQKFVLIIRGYSSDMYMWQFEEKYHLHALHVAKEMGYTTCVLIKCGGNILKNDPDFDPGTEVLEYKNIFNFTLNLIKLSFLHSIFYTNSYEIESFISPLFSRKVIFMAHGQPKRDTFLKQTIQDFFYFLFAKIRLNNISEQNFLKKHSPNNKLKVVPLPVAIQTFRKEYNPHSEEIVYFGNITYTKDFSTILKALQILTMQRPLIQLHIIGNIHDDNFWKVAKKLNIEKNMIIHGYLTQQEAASTLNQFSVCINSSIKEGQCLAVYHAALAGCALCLPTIISFKDIFRDKALFHNTHDSDKLAQNILFYLTHHDLRQKHVLLCQNMITQNYSRETIEPLMRDLFNL